MGPKMSKSKEETDIKITSDLLRGKTESEARAFVEWAIKRRGYPLSEKEDKVVTQYIDRLRAGDVYTDQQVAGELLKGIGKDFRK